MRSPAAGTRGVVLQDSQHGPHDGLLVDATVRDVAGRALPGATVTITGSRGVLFSTGAGTPQSPLTTAPGDDLTTSVEVTTTADGALPPLHAFFTQAGSTTITLTAGPAEQLVRLIAPNSSDAYRVSVGDVAGNPGSRLVVMGTVLDAFGNPVPNVLDGLSLTVSDPRLGNLHTTTPTTDASGMFSTAIRASDTTKGSADLVVALTRADADPSPNAEWLALGGVQLRHGVFTGTAKLTLSGRVRFSATPSLVGGGQARLRGTAEPGALVDIYAKPAGREHSTRIGSVAAGDDGNWGIGTTIASTTHFRARTGKAVTSILTTTVQSNETAVAEALGDGQVRFDVDGVPNVKGAVNIYEAGTRLAHVASDRHGDVSTVIRSTPGRHRFVVYFVAPGTKLKGRSVTVSVT